MLALHVHGRAVVEQAGTWEVAAGDLQIIPAGARHLTLESHGSEVLGVGFSPAGLRSAGLGALLAPLESVRRGRSPVRRLPADVGQRLHTVLSLLEDELRRGDPGAPQVGRALLEVALSEVGRLAETPAPGRSSLVADALAYLEVHALEALSLADVARALGRSPSHLATVVRRETGQTVGQWLVALRMGEARRRLEQTDELVEVIGERVGYPDPSHFSRVFRRAHGASPSQWRARR